MPAASPAVSVRRIKRMEGDVDVETAIVRQVRREANIGDLDSRMFQRIVIGRPTASLAV
jgi:hypothetical protein